MTKVVEYLPKERHKDFLQKKMYLGSHSVDTMFGFFGFFGFLGFFVCYISHHGSFLLQSYKWIGYRTGWVGSLCGAIL